MSTLVQVDYGRTGSVDGDYIGGEVSIRRSAHIRSLEVPDVRGICRSIWSFPRPS